MQKDQPSTQPVEAVKLPKAKLPLLRPFLAMARVQMRMARTPAKVKGIVRV
jgi:hypothetical protein